MNIAYLQIVLLVLSLFVSVVTYLATRKTSSRSVRTLIVSQFLATFSLLANKILHLYGI